MSGRSSRSEFWWFAFFCCVAFAALQYVDARIWGWDLKAGTKANILTSLFVILASIPFTSIAVRRAQDVGLHGAIVFSPLVFSWILYWIRSLMFGWLQISDTDYGNLASDYWIRLLFTISGMAVPALAALVLIVLLLPSRFAERHITNPH